MMSVFAWLFGLVLPESTSLWIAIVVSGVLFGLGHLPSYIAAGCERSPQLVVTQIALNLWASLIFGYIFWSYGLAAAMLSHALFHLVWFPIDITMGAGGSRFHRAATGV